MEVVFMYAAVLAGLLMIVVAVEVIYARRVRGCEAMMDDAVQTFGFQRELDSDDGEPVLVGEYEGTPMTIWLRNVYRRTQPASIRIEIPLSEPWEDLTIRPADSPHAPPLEEASTGDPDFDRRFQVVHLTSSPRVDVLRDEIVETIDGIDFEYDDFCVGDGRLMVERKGMLTNVVGVNGLLVLLVVLQDFAECLDGAVSKDGDGDRSSESEEVAEEAPVAETEEVGW